MAEEPAELNNVPQHVRNRDFVLDAVLKNPTAMEFAEELQDDCDALVAILQQPQGWRALQWASCRLRADETVMTALMTSKAWRGVQYVSPELRKSPLMLEAVRHNAASLQFASENGKDDELILSAIESSFDALLTRGLHCHGLPSGNDMNSEDVADVASRIGLTYESTRKGNVKRGVLSRAVGAFHRTRQALSRWDCEQAYHENGGLWSVRTICLSTVRLQREDGCMLVQLGYWSKGHTVVDLSLPSRKATNSSSGRVALRAVLEELRPIDTSIVVEDVPTEEVECTLTTSGTILWKSFLYSALLKPHFVWSQASTLVRCASSELRKETHTIAKGSSRNASDDRPRIYLLGDSSWRRTHADPRRVLLYAWLSEELFDRVRGDSALVSRWLDDLRPCELRGSMPHVLVASRPEMSLRRTMPAWSPSGRSRCEKQKATRRIRPETSCAEADKPKSRCEAKSR